MLLAGSREALNVLVKKPPRRQARSQRDERKRAQSEEQ